MYPLTEPIGDFHARSAQGSGVNTTRLKMMSDILLRYPVIDAADRNLVTLFLEWAPVPEKRLLGTIDGVAPKLMAFRTAYREASRTRRYSPDAVLTLALIILIIMISFWRLFIKS